MKPRFFIFLFLLLFSVLVVGSFLFIQRTQISDGLIPQNTVLFASASAQGLIGSLDKPNPTVTSYQPYSSTSCVQDSKDATQYTCSKTIGERYADPDGTKIEDASSLKDGFSSIKCVVTKADVLDADVECVDYNLTSMTLNINKVNVSLINEGIVREAILNDSIRNDSIESLEIIGGIVQVKLIGEKNLTNISIKGLELVTGTPATSIPIKYYELNDTGSLVEDSKKESTIDTSLSAVATSKTYSTKIGDVIHVGESSTTVVLQDADVTDDSWINPASSDTNYGSTQWSSLGSSERKKMMYSFENTLPTNVTVLDANLTLYLESNNFDGGVGAEGVNFTIHRIIEPWDESNITYNNAPNISIPSEVEQTRSPFYYFDGTDTGDVYYDFNVTLAVNNASKNGDDKFSLYFNDTILVGVAGSTDDLKFSTKEDEIGHKGKPKLTVTYVEGIAVSDCGTLDITGATYTLQNDVSSAGTCFTIGADNITLDGAGYLINYSQGASGHGIDNNGYDNVIIKNTRIIHGNDFGASGSNGILYTNAVGGSIHNNTVEAFRSSSIAVRLVTSSNIDVYNNNMSALDYGFMLVGASHNNIHYNNIESIGIIITSTTNNTFSSNSVLQRGPWGVGRLYIGEGINNTIFINNTIESYDFDGSGSKSSFENTTLAKIEFTEPVNGTGVNLVGNFSSDILFGNNSIALQGNYAGLNRSANITLYGIGDRSITNLSILVDDLTACDSGTTPACSNFTALDADTVEFNVSSWSNNFSIGDVAGGAGESWTNVTACGTLDTPNTEYRLQNNVTSILGDCFIINDDNITLNGQDYTVTFGTVGNGVGVELQRAHSFLLKNISLISDTNTNGRYGIHSDSGSSTHDNLTVIDSTIFVGGIGIYLKTSADGLNLYRNNITAKNVYPTSIRVRTKGCDISDNYITTTKGSGGNNLWLDFDDNTICTIKNNTIIKLNGGSSQNYASLHLDDMGNKINVTQNYIYSGKTGMYLGGGSLSGRLIYNNIINVTNGVYTVRRSGGLDKVDLNITKTSGTNIINGTNLGGNFWATTTGTGFSETCVDSDGDDICDSSYTPISEVVDYLPLAVPASGDSQDPFIRIDRPRNQTYVNGNVKIRATATDNVAVVNVTMWYLNSTEPLTFLCSDDTDKYDCSWNTKDFTANEEGYTIIANATDNAGNTNTTSVLLKIDRFIPETDNLTIYYPLDQESIRNGQTLWLDLVVKDTAGAGMNTTEDDLLNMNQTMNTTLDHVAGTLDAGLWSKWNQSIVINSLLTDSLADVIVYAWDNATPDNNLREDLWNVQIDNEIPTWDNFEHDPLEGYNGSWINFQVYAYDNFDLRNYSFETNATGVWTNNTGTIDGVIDIVQVGKIVEEGNWSYRFHLTDDAGNINTTSWGAVNVLEDAPGFTIYLDSPSDESGTKVANTNFTFHYNNGNATNCTLILNGDQNQTYHSPVENVTNGINQTIEDGTHLWNIGCYDNIANGTVESGETRTLYVDSTNPSIDISLLTEEPPDPATWDTSQEYYFNATITDNIQLQTSFIDFNNVNYTPTQAGDVFTYNPNSLDAGVYSYYWHANDTAGNRNVTAVQTYTINNATGHIQLALNDTEANQTANYPTPTKVTGSTLYGTVNITRDGVDVLNETGVYVTMINGTYNYTACSSGDKNHDLLCLTRWVHIVDTGLPVITFNYPANNTFNKTADQNLSINITDNLDLQNATLNIRNESDDIVNQTTVTYPTGTTETTLGIIYTFTEGIWRWFYEVFDTAGNSATSDERTITIDQTDPNINITYPQSTSYGLNVSALNYSYTETNAQACWYSRDAGVTNSTSDTAGNNFTDVQSVEGSNTWTVFCNDTAQNENVTSVTFQKDTTVPIITDVAFYAINSSKGILTNQTAFNTANLSAIEFMNITFSVIDSTNVTGDIVFYFTANGSSSCSLGNLQDGTCYNYTNSEATKWIVVKNGTATTTYDDTHMGTARGDSLEIAWTGNDTTRNYTIKLDEHYNPNVFKWYDSLYNFSDVKWQNGNDQRITRNNMLKIELNMSIIPINANEYKLDFRVNTTNNPPSQSLQAWACNSTYSAGNPETQAECSLVAIKGKADFQDDETKFRAVFTNNLIDTLGDIEYIILMTDENAASKYYELKTYNITSSEHSQRWEYSTDSGDTWAASGDGYETELNINWFFSGNSPTQFIFKVEVNDSENNVGNSSEYAMTWDITEENFPPLIDLISPPINTTVNGTVQVNWVVAEPNDDSTLVNITVWNQSTTIIIATDVYDIYTNYTWDVSAVTDGDYNLTVLVWENATTEGYFVNATHDVIIANTIDTTFPIINLTAPMNTTYNAIQSELNYTVSDDTSLETCWYTLNDITNTTITCGNNVTGLSYAQGQYTWRVYVNDTTGNFNSSSVTFVVDTDAPALNLTVPVNDTITNIVAQNLTANISDNLGIKNVTLNVRNETGDIINQTVEEYGSGVIEITLGIVYTFTEGIFSWFYIATDWASNQVTTEERTITIDLTNTTVVITYPTNSSNFTTSLIEVNYTVKDTNLESCWYTNSSGEFNYSLTCGNNVTLRTWDQGDNLVFIYANDSASNENSSVVSFFVDSIVPTIDITAPLNQTYTTAQTELNYTITDLNLQACWYTLNDTSNSTITCGTNITGLTQTAGQYTYRVYGNDTYGNENLDSVTFVVDAVPPSLNLTAPQNTTYNSIQSELNYTVTDDNLESCWYTLNDVSNQTITCGNNVTGLSYAQGQHTWTIYANDTAGYLNYSSVTFVVDTDAPALNLTVPVNDTITNIVAQNLTTNITDNLGIKNATLNIRNETGDIINQTTEEYGGGVVQVTLGIVYTFTEGIFTWFYQATDWANNQATTEERTITIDLTNAVVNVTYPINSTNHSTTSITVNYTIVEDNINNCWWSETEGLSNNSVTCGNNITGGWSEGVNLVFVYVNDSAGNVNNDYVSFRVDTTIPVIDLTAPLNQSYDLVQTELNYTVTDASLQTCRYSTDNGVSNQTITCGNNVTGLSYGEGQYTWWVDAQDSLGNNNSDSVTFIVDLNTPQINITAPLNTTYQESQTELNYTVSDTFLESCWYTLDDITNVSLTCGDNATGLDSGQGQHTWRVYANDSVGRENSSSITFLVADTTLPYFTNIPSDKAIDFGENFIDNFNATDETGFDSFVVNDTVHFEIGRTNGNINNATELGVGIYIVQVTINDTSNNLNSTNYTLTVNQIASEVNLTLNKVQSNISIEVGSTIPLNGTLVIGYETSLLSLFNDGNLINKDSIEVYNSTLFNSPGLFNITVIYSADQNYTQSSETWWVNVSDSGSPQINITYPMNTSYNLVQTIINYTVNDLNLQACWYSTDNGISNTTVTCGNNVSGLDSGQGQSTWLVGANDSTGNYNSSAVTFYVDSIAPVITIINPEVITYTVNDTDTNVTLNEIGDTCIQSIDAGVTNETMTKANDTRFNHNLTNLAEGSYTITFFCNDTLGNLATATRGFGIDIGPPSVSLEFPTDDLYLDYGYISFNYTPTDSGDLDTCKLYGNWTGVWHANQTDDTITDAVTNVFLVNISEGGYKWNVWCNKSNGLEDFSQQGNLTFYIDLTDPVANLTVPANDTYTATPEQNLTVDMSDNMRLRNGTVFIKNETGDIVNQTTETFAPGVTVTTLGIIYTFTEGIWNWFYTVYDWAGNAITTEERTINVDLTDPAFIDLTETPIDPATYVPLQNYEFNVTIVESYNVSSAGIEFDGINYTATNVSNIYNFTISDLNVSVYYYYWWATDNAGNYNTTALLDYTVGLATSEVNLTLNATEDNITIQQGESIVLNGTLITGDPSATLRLYKNGTLINEDITEVSNNTQFDDAGIENITVIYVNSENYTQSSETWWVTISYIDTRVPWFTNIPEDKSIAYGSNFIDDFNATDDIGLDTFVVNDTVHFEIGRTNGNINNVTELGVGIYIVQVTINDTSNNLNSTNYTLTVTQAIGEVYMYIDGVRANKTINNETVNTNLTAVGINATGLIQIYINNSLWNNATSPVTNITNFTAPGNYTINATFLGNANFTAASEIFNIQVITSTAIPVITIHFPATNGLYTDDPLDLNTSANIEISSWYYSFNNGSSNTSFSPNTTLSLTTTGKYQVTVFANSTTNVWGSQSVIFDYVHLDKAFSRVGYLHIFILLFLIGMLVIYYSTRNFVFYYGSMALILVWGVYIMINGFDILETTYAQMLAFVLIGVGLIGSVMGVYRHLMDIEGGYD